MLPGQPPPPPQENSVDEVPPPPPPSVEPSSHPPPLPDSKDTRALESASQSLKFPSDNVASCSIGSSESNRPRRKRRFSPSAQDPPPGSAQGKTSADIGSGAAHQHRASRSDVTSSSSAKALRDPASDKTISASSSPSSSKSKAPLTANQWEDTAFVGDASGAKRMKFLRLMGLGKTGTITSKPESPEEASREAARRQQQMSSMERQYEQGRRQRHRFN